MNQKTTILALEEEATGEAHVEKEFVYYANIESLSVLSEYPHEHQVQLTIPLDKIKPGVDGRMRVRETTRSSAEPEYVLTTKMKTGDSAAKIETSVPVSADMYKVFELLATGKMEKRRYTIPIEGREECWEIDVFPLPGTDKFCNWVKIDYEFKSNQPPPPLPDIFKDVLSENSGGALPVTDEGKAFIRELYETVFIQKS